MTYLRGRWWGGEEEEEEEEEGEGEEDDIYIHIKYIYILYIYIYMAKSVNTPTCNFAPMLCWHFRVILLRCLG